MGALLVVAPPGAAVLLGGLALGRLARHTAPATLVAQLGLVPLLGATRGRNGALAGACVLVPMLAKRLLGNTAPHLPAGRQVWRNRLLHDRDVR
jgi:hypothetical protein